MYSLYKFRRQKLDAEAKAAQALREKGGSERTNQIRMMNLYGATKDELALRSKSRLVSWMEDAPDELVTAVTSSALPPSPARHSFRDTDSSKNISTLFSTVKHVPRVACKAGGLLDVERTQHLHEEQGIQSPATPESPAADLYLPNQYPYRERLEGLEGPPMRYRAKTPTKRQELMKRRPHSSNASCRRTRSPSPGGDSLRRSSSAGHGLFSARAAARARPLHQPRPSSSASAPRRLTSSRSVDPSKWVSGEDMVLFESRQDTKTRTLSGSPVPSPINYGMAYSPPMSAFRTPDHSRDLSGPFISNVPSDTYIEPAMPSLRLRRSRNQVQPERTKVFGMSLRSTPSLSPTRMRLSN